MATDNIYLTYTYSDIHAVVIDGTPYPVAQVREALGELQALRAERDDLRAHFAAAQRRGDGFLAKLDEARIILGCEPDCTLHDRAQAAVNEIARLQSIIDQAINNLRVIKALNDDPHIEEVVDRIADMLGEALYGEENDTHP